MSTITATTIKANTIEESTSGGATYFTAKAWVNFNGTGTVAIRYEGNVSSITDNGTGDYTANFSNSLPVDNSAVSESYTAEVSSQHTNGYLAGLGTTSVRFQHYNSANSVNKVDKGTVCYIAIA